MENSNANWNDFFTKIIQRDVSFQVSSSFLNDEEQNKAQMPALGKAMTNFRSEVQKNRVNAVEEIPRTVDPNQKGRQNATRFCNCCQRNGHTPSWCRRKILDEELKRTENERTAERKNTFAQDYIERRGPGHGSEQWVRGQGFQRTNKNYTNDGLTRNSPTVYQSFLPDQNSHTEKTMQTMEDQMINGQISHSKEAIEIVLEMNLSTIRIETGETMQTFVVLHRLKGESFQKVVHITSRVLISLTILLSLDPKIGLRVVLHLMNENFHRTIIRRHLIWFASPQMTIPLTNFWIYPLNY